MSDRDHSYSISAKRLRIQDVGHSSNSDNQEAENIAGARSQADQEISTSWIFAPDHVLQRILSNLDFQDKKALRAASKSLASRVMETDQSMRSWKITISESNKDDVILGLNNACEKGITSLFKFTLHFCVYRQSEGEDVVSTWKNFIWKLDINLERDLPVFMPNLQSLYISCFPDSNEEYNEESSEDGFIALPAKNIIDVHCSTLQSLIIKEDESVPPHWCDYVDSDLPVSPILDFLSLDAVTPEAAVHLLNWGRHVTRLDVGKLDLQYDEKGVDTEFPNLTHLRADVGGVPVINNNREHVKVLIYRAYGWIEELEMDSLPLVTTLVLDLEDYNGFFGFHPDDNLDTLPVIIRCCPALKKLIILHSREANSDEIKCDNLTELVMSQACEWSTKMVWENRTTLEIIVLGVNQHNLEFLLFEGHFPKLRKIVLVSRNAEYLTNSAAIGAMRQNHPTADVVIINQTFDDYLQANLKHYDISEEFLYPTPLPDISD